jgi:hypothetical protein
MKWTHYFTQKWHVQYRSSHTKLKLAHDGKTLLGRPRRRHKGTIKKHHQETGHKNVGWIQLAQDRDDMVMNTYVKTGNVVSNQICQSHCV